LSSSRGKAILSEGLPRDSAGVKYAAFPVSYGRLRDHLAVLEFMLRDKARRGGRLKTVFLLIDLDTIGERPRRDEALQLLPPPELSDEAPLRFWWRNLTAIQFGAWWRVLRSKAWGRAFRNVLQTAALAADASKPSEP